MKNIKKEILGMNVNIANYNVIEEVTKWITLYD